VNLNFSALRGTICELRGVTPDLARIALGKASHESHGLAAVLPKAAAVTKAAAPAEHSAASAVDDLARTSGGTYLPEAGVYVDDVSGATSGARRGSSEIDGGGYDEMGNASRGSDWGGGGVYDESGGGYFGDF